MAKIGVSIADLMQDPNVSLYTNSFSPGNTFVKRSSFKKGEQPEHLKDNAIQKGEIPQSVRDKGSVTIAGQQMPATAAFVKLTHRDDNPLTENQAEAKITGD